MDKKIIKNNFSRYAHLYDGYAHIQNKAAAKLIDCIEPDGIRDILEVGCGTGNYTAALRLKFKEANITAVDISDKMVSIARDKLRGSGIKFVVADAEDLRLEDKFDLITSNVSLQWFRSLKGSLTAYKGMLKENGIVVFSIFGSGTFYELGTVLKEGLREAQIPAQRFSGLREIKDALEANFSQSRASEAYFRESFASLRELLRKIKYSGIRGEGLTGKISLTAELLDKLEASYKDKFNRIEATYQTFLCWARL